MLSDNVIISALLKTQFCILKEVASFEPTPAHVCEHILTSVGHSFPQIKLAISHVLWFSDRVKHEIQRGNSLSSVVLNCMSHTVCAIHYRL